MKALLIRIFAGVIALGTLLYFLACSPGGQNTEQSQNQNSARTEKEAIVTDGPRSLGPCDPVDDPGTKGEDIRTKIKGEMSPALKNHLRDADNTKGTFTIEVKKADDGEYFEAYIRGRISGDDNLKELSDILNNFQGKSSCMRKVFFFPDDNIGTAIRAFEWSSCEYPLETCPNGECKPRCDRKDGNSNTNTNSNTNSNGNANSNANANRGGKTTN